MTSLKSMKFALLVGAAIVAAPGPLLAQTAPAPRAPTAADLEARLKTLESALAEVKAQLEAEKAARAAVDPKLETLAKQTTEAVAKVEAAAKAEGFKVGDATVKFNGFFKAEGLISDYSNGDASGTARDFYLPSGIPTGASSTDEDYRVDGHAKQTRMMMTVTRAVGAHKLGGYLETDFQSAPGTQGSENVTNAYNLALRRVYVTMDNWLFGQDWTTFQNVAALPESTDFIGPSEGTVFARQVMVRYTHKISDTMNLLVALENPETVLAGLGAQDDDQLPDLTAKLMMKVGKADLALAGLARQLSVQQGAALDEKAVGWGVSASGKAPFGKNDVRFMLNYGEGAGRYLGVGFAPDAILVNTAARQELETVPVLSGFVAGRFMLTDKTRTNLVYSFQSVDNPTGISATSANDEVWSASVNVFHSPVKGIDLGLEYRHAEKELVSGADGSLDRIHVIAKHTF